MLKELISEPVWDRPFFKKLAHNDTGVAAGHQAGIVIPKDLRDYLPGLIREVTHDSPTVDKPLRADLVVDGETQCRVATRYQFQTWGKTRPPESRLTGNLGELRNAAVEGDYVVFQRSMHEVDLYRLILVGKESEDHQRIEAAHKSQRWGLLTDVPPLSETDLEQSRVRLAALHRKPFSLFDPNARTVVTETTKIARSIVFRESLLELYGRACAVCRLGLRIENAFEVEGAHIVPHHRRGIDDARNGLALCRTHHWAFDNGLFGVDCDRKIIVPESVLQAKANKPLRGLIGIELTEPGDLSLAPHPHALEWHRANTLLAT